MASTADPQSQQAIRRLAADPDKVWLSKQVNSDLLAHNLTIYDVCDCIIAWIDAGERVKPTTLHSFPGRIGQPAYEIKPRIHGKMYYLKVTIDDSGMSSEALGLLSAHPDH